MLFRKKYSRHFTLNHMDVYNATFDIYIFDTTFEITHSLFMSNFLIDYFLILLVFSLCVYNLILEGAIKYESSFYLFYLKSYPII